jgi:multidrug resistance efflux pump
MLKNKWVAWLLVMAVLLLPMPALFRYLRTFIVRNAVVTAYVYDVRAPIDGVVVSVNATPGTVSGQSPVVVLRNSRTPHTEIDMLEARYREKSKSAAFLQEEIAALQSRMIVSESHLSDYRTLLQHDLDQTVAILKARQEGQEARLKEAAQLRTRNSQLIKINAVALADFDRIEADYLHAESLVQSTRLEQKQIEHRRQMLRNDLFPSNLSDGVLQIQNQINTLFISILEYKRRIQETEADLAADCTSLQSARADLERRSTAAVQLPDTSVIWEVDVRTGMEVLKGDRILSTIDRSTLLVDVAIDDSTLALIHPGHPVRIRLFGSERFIDGKVVLVSGSAADRSAARFAATVKAKSVRDGRVLVRIDDPELYRDTARFCGVGHTAFAEFEGIGLIEQYLGSFLR